MSESSKRRQAQLDAMAIRRQHYKDAAIFLSSKATREVAKGLVTRLETMRDDYIAVYDSLDPTDQLGVAKCQEGRAVCGQILLDFDPEICKKAITKLDVEIKKIHNTIGQQDKEPTGFNSLEL